jgi:CheY-like chemotaxis protein
MPLMSGLEFLDYRRRDPRLHDIPVILATGNSEALREFSMRGATALRKPFDMDMLTGIVREHCA